MNDEALRLLEFESMKAHFASRLSTGPGRDRLAALRPVHDDEELDLRLGALSEASALLDRSAPLPLGGCRAIGPLFDRVRESGRPLEAEELFLVAETLEQGRALVLAIADRGRSFPELPLPRLSSIAERIPGFTLLVDRIALVVDDRGRVRDDASPRLDATRREIRIVRERIERRVADLLARKDLRGCLQEAGVRFRSGRPVLAVKSERRGEVRGVLHDVSTSGATHFVEPEEVVAEGNRLEDLLAEERREVSRILWEITVRVLEQEAEIRTALDAMARIDLAQAGAAAVRDDGFAIPERSAAGRILFRSARHPLLLRELGRDRTVPIDLRLLDDFHLLVVTGPNTGGKTAALKTLGLLLLMAQSGLPVPAARAEFAPLAEVFVDVGDEQSLTQNLSTFSSHITRIARFLARADRTTLVLLDELGAGTDPAEGGALGRAILEFLAERGVPAVVTTHLGALKAFAFTREGVANASVEFDVETLSPTYRLLVGTAGASNALVIAERLGLPKEVVAKAKSYVAPGDRASAELLEKAQEIRSSAERRLRDAESYRAESRDARQRALEELAEAERRRGDVEREAEAEMEAALARVRALVREYAKELMNAPKPFGPKAGELLERAEAEIRATPLGRRREEFAAGLVRGDEVYVPKLGGRFLVHQVKKKDRTLVVTRGALRVEIPFDDVTFADRP